MEYYKSIHDFNSFTSVALSELADAPFLNLVNVPQATKFKLFLEDQVKKGFPSMKTVESFLKSHPDVLNPLTGKPIQTVMWPATNQVR